MRVRWPGNDSGHLLIRRLMPLLALALVALVFLIATAARQHPGLVVLLVVDTLRADHLGCYGYPAIETPNIDRLAREGILYENAITTAPLTLPAVTSIVTGAYPAQHGLRDNGAYHLEERWTTLAERFRDAGYATAAFVSSDVLSADHHLSQGFSVYDADFSAPHESYDPLMKMLDDQPAGVERRADATVDRALAWAAEHRGEDAFVMVHLFDPHLPRDPPPAFRKAYGERTYDGEIAFTDQQIGRLLKGLAKGRHAESVLTILVADHGEGLQDHGEELHGFLLFDEIMRVPLILHGSGLPKGRRVSEEVRTIDLAPTLCALARMTPPPECTGLPLPGIEYPQAGGGRDGDPWNAGRAGGDRQPRVAYLETFRPRLSYGWCELRGLRTERWKLISGPECELYDLSADPREQVDLRLSHPEVCDSLARLMDDVALASVARGTYSASVASMTPEQVERLESLGYLAASGSRVNGADVRDGSAGSEPGGGATAADSLAVWQFPPEQRGANLGLPHPGSQLATYNRRVVARSYCQVGLAALRSRDLARAQEFYGRAIEADPEYADAHLGLAQAHDLAGDSDEARAVLRRALAAGVRAVAVYAHLAELEHLAGDLTTAEATIREAIDLFPQSGWCWSVLSLVLLDQERLKEAAECAAYAISVEPNFARAHFMQGLIAREMNDRRTAQRAWTRYLELEPQAPDIGVIRAYLTKT
jgi:arylsulfatase A-like enzyme